MEELILRFPLVGSQIFAELDDFSLGKCRETCKLWCDFINNEIFYKNRINEILAEKMKGNGMRGELSQIHAAAVCGQTRVLVEILKQEINKNPPNNRKITPLHLAAENGFLSICKYIIEQTDDKNPGDERGRTPLHFAAQNGHFRICELIENNVDVKNPREGRFGKTPLHNAAKNGHLEICKLIIENIEKKNLAKVSDKNPADSSGTTPIHEAARFGKAEVFMFLMENIGDESVDQKDIHPRCNRAGTPLQIAEVMFPPDVIRKVKNKYFQLKRDRILRNYQPKRWRRNQSAAKALKAFGRVCNRRQRKVKRLP